MRSIQPREDNWVATSLRSSRSDYYYRLDGVNHPLLYCHLPVAEVQLTGVAPLEAVHHRLNIFLSQSQNAAHKFCRPDKFPDFPLLNGPCYNTFRLIINQKTTKMHHISFSLTNWKDFCFMLCVFNNIGTLLMCLKYFQYFSIKIYQ